MTAVVTTPPRPALIGTALLWVMLMIVEVGAQLCLKEGAGALEGMSFGLPWLMGMASTPAIVAAAFLYVASFVCWMAILARMPVSRAFPLTAMIQIGVVASSVLLLNEALGMWRVLGIGFILLGVALLSRD